MMGRLVASFALVLVTLCAGCEEEPASPDRGAPLGNMPGGQLAPMADPTMQPMNTTGVMAGSQAPAPAGTDSGMTPMPGETLADMVMMCSPACMPGQICDTTQGVCMMAPEVGCPGGCADGQICQDATCVEAPSDGSVDMACVTDAMSINSTTTQACAECLCTAGTGCLAELSACTSDGATCGDLVNCGANMGCEGGCCFCDPATAPASNGPCGALGENINTGVCAAQIAAAVGLAFPVDIFMAAGITDACASGGGTACAHATEFGACAGEKCSAVCTPAPACM